MKSILFSLLILLQFSLHAQQGIHSNKRTASPAYRVVNYNQQVQVKEAELTQLLGKFEMAHESIKSVLRDDVQGLLYELFDLSLRKKEDEAKLLGEKITEMEGNEAFSDRSTEIQQYKTRLRKVESSLKFRRENRERIVQQHLQKIVP